MFYDRFIELCKERGVSPSAVMVSIGLNKSNATFWKKGSIPKGDTLQKLADYFCVTVDFLLGNEGAALRYSFTPFPSTGTRYKTGDIVSEDVFQKIAADTNLPPNILWRDESGILHFELPTDGLDERNTYNLLRMCFAHLNIEGKKKVAQYAEDILPRYRAETAPESTPPPSEGTDTTPPPDAPETASEGE